MNHDPITRVLAAAAVALLTFILAVVLIASARSPSMSERVDELDRQLQFVSCLLLIEPQDRTAEAVAGCQVNSAP